jgi:chromosome segregation ATPase
MRKDFMQLQQIPRTIVTTWLRTARLPLGAVEAVVRRGEHDIEWPPAIAFDSFEATVKQLAGSIFHDDQLTQDGQVAQARVAQLRKAVELEAVAEQRKAQADTELQQRRQIDEQRREAVQQQANQAETALERERAEKERRAAETDARKREQAAQVETVEEKIVEHEDRDARATRIAAERKALQREREAVTAKARVTNLDGKLKSTKAARKTKQPARKATTATARKAATPRKATSAGGRGAAPRKK